MGQHIVMVFVDGLGIGAADATRNPIHSGVCPCIEEMLEQSKPIDACLGVDGLPQSATGQTALLTGVNAAEVMGRHIEGFPGPRLREIIQAESVFHQLDRLGLSSTFANAYFIDEVREVDQLPFHSVTTVAAMSGHGKVRIKRDMLADQAVYQDLTRALLTTRGYEGPLVTPIAAAGHLCDVAAQQNLTLFEYFQTDRAGHSRQPERVEKVLCDLDEFLGALRSHCMKNGMNLILTSDHGNIEELGEGTHTRNAVPLFVEGPDVVALSEGVESLVDVTPAMVRTLIK